MRRARPAVIGLLGAFTLLGCPAHGRPRASRPARVAATSADAALERQVLDLVNRHRRTLGLRALAPDARVTEQARAHSAAMADGRTPFGHQGFAERSDALKGVLRWRRTAENVASNRGHRDPAAEAMRGWLASRAHRENLDGPYDLTGIGVARSRSGEVFFTQFFVGR